MKKNGGNQRMEAIHGLMNEYDKTTDPDKRRKIREFSHLISETNHNKKLPPI